MPINLVAIVVAQLITFAIIMQLFGRKTNLAISDWLLVVGVGTGLGLLMDAVIGTFGIFAYLPQGISGSPVVPRELPIHVLLFNAFASYGLASATVVPLSSHFLRQHSLSRRWMAVCGAVALCGVVGVLLFHPGSVAVLFAWGGTIIAFGELVLGVKRKTGPFLSLFTLNDWRPFGRFWLLCASVGAVYELVNSAFPFWVWLPDSHVSEVGMKTLIAVAGYLALFHPLVVLYVLLRK